ncbi:MAG: DUF58 domain-containing protein [Deltaproteobacteria bacterium]|nr:DUF58 domain-containing protein [Deltaproteobacteria bacterium]
MPRSSPSEIALKVRRLARRIVDPLPPTPLGLAVAAASALALGRYGLERLDLVLFVMGALGLALSAISLLTVSLAGILLKLRIKPPSSEGAARRVEARSVFRTEFSAPPYWFLPLLRVGWEWEEPPGFDVHAVSTPGRQLEDVVAAERGIWRRIVRRIVVEDAFGLFRVAFRCTEQRELIVLPHAGELRQMPVVRSLAAGDDLSHPLGLPEGDRVDTRRYAPGDPVRLILWKTFARTRQLMVRVPERAIAPARRTLGYLVAGPSDEPAAAAARVAIESGAFGSDWLFGADGDPTPASALDEALLRIAGSSRARTEGAVQLARFIRENDRFATSRVVLFVPPRPGPWLDLVCSFALERPRGIDVVVATDGIAGPPASAARWGATLRSAASRAFGALLARGPAVRRTRASEIDAVLTRLAHARVRALLVDRASGKAFGKEHQRALARVERAA